MICALFFFCSVPLFFPLVSLASWVSVSRPVMLVQMTDDLDTKILPKEMVR